MTQLFRKAKTLTRLTSWLVLVCLLGSLGAPALQASTSSAAKATLETVGGSTDSSEAVTSSEETDSSEAAESFEATSTSEEEATTTEGEDRSYLVARNDREQLKLTLGTIVGSLMLGVVGFSFGWVGLALGSALGAGLGYLISKQIFSTSSSGDSAASNSSGSSSSVVSSGYGYTAPEGSTVRELEEAYFEALTEYRQALRGDDRTRTGEARVAYQQAYEALIRAKSLANQGY